MECSTVFVRGMCCLSGEGANGLTGLKVPQNVASCWVSVKYCVCSHLTYLVAELGKPGTEKAIHFQYPCILLKVMGHWSVSLHALSMGVCIHGEWNVFFCCCVKITTVYENIAFRSKFVGPLYALLQRDNGYMTWNKTQWGHFSYWC